MSSWNVTIWVSKFTHKCWLMFMHPRFNGAGICPNIYPKWSTYVTKYSIHAASGIWSNIYIYIGVISQLVEVLATAILTGSPSHFGAKRSPSGTGPGHQKLGGQKPRKNRTASFPCGESDTCCIFHMFSIRDGFLRGFNPFLTVLDSSWCALMRFDFGFSQHQRTKGELPSKNVISHGFVFSSRVY